MDQVRVKSALEAVRTMIGLAAVGYVLCVLAAWALVLLVGAPQLTWRISLALAFGVGVSGGAWLLWQARRQARRARAAAAGDVRPKIIRQPGPLDWAGEVEHLLEAGRVRTLGDQAEQAAATAVELTGRIEADWQHEGRFDAELAARARAAQAEAEAAATEYAFAAIVEAERLRSSLATPTAGVSEPR
jgi:hypothetical protein